MQYYDTTNKTGIVNEVLSLVDSTITDYPIEDITRRVNIGLDRFMSLALQANDDWQFDDINHNDYPIGTKNLVSGQQDYTFPDEILDITRVEIKNSDGIWIVLDPIDQNDISVGLEEYNKTDAVPKAYDKLGNSMFLYPAPNYNSTDGLKVVYKRNAKRLLDTDTTLEVGIPTIFHGYLAYMAALPFAISKGLNTVNQLQARIDKFERDIQDHFATRQKDKKMILQTKRISGR